MRRLLLPIVALFATAVAADEPQPPHRNLVSLAVTAQEDVDSDLLVVRLAAQHEAPRQAQAADGVNQDMNWALAAARQHAAVEVQTLDYRTHPVYDDNRVSAWRAQQALRLESTDVGALTALLGTLQERLAVESLGYEVSPAVREQTEQRLIDAAIARFRARATQIARAFDRSDYAIVNVHVGSSGHHPPPMPYASRALSMQAAAADPGLAPGQQTISVDVSGSIELE